MRFRSTLGVVALVGYIGTIFAANWSVERYGVIDVGFGLKAPAAVLFVGLAFTLRDVVHRELGRRPVVVAILVGAALSFFVAPAFALASGGAFLVSEGADFAVYTPLAGRSWLGAVTLSNTVGLVIDSALFLWLAFGSLEFFWGQVLGKAYMTGLAVCLLAAARTLRARTPQAA